jgi:phospholipase A-2-activating protein
MDSGSSSTPPPAAIKSDHFPVRKPVVFDVIKNTTGMLNKFTEFATALDKGDESKISIKVDALKQIIAILESTSHYHTSTFTPRQYAVIENCLKWPVDKVFPVLDLIRLLLTHPGNCDTD